MASLRAAFFAAVGMPAGLALLAAGCGFAGMATSSDAGRAADRVGEDALAPDAIVLDPVDGGAELTLTSGAPAAQVDLEQEGTLGWIHWGTKDGDTKSFNQKVAAAFPLPTFAVTGSTDIHTFDNNLTTFRWTNGTPIATQSATRNFVYVKGKPTVRVIRVVGIEPQRFVVYAGLFKCKALLTVTLGAGTDARTVSATLDNMDNAYARYVIDHRAKDPATALAITWELTDSYDQSNANVTLAAATLAPR